jgi:hypothetical protein
MATKQTTEDLIRRLAAEPAPARFAEGRIALTVLGALVLGLGLYLVIHGPRPDLAQSLAGGVTVAKPLLPALLLVTGLTAALRLARPGQRAGFWVWGVVVVADAGASLILATMTQDGVAAMKVGAAAFKCLSMIVLLSALPLVLGIAQLARGATLRPALSGAMLGMASGAGAAAGYALACTEDAPLFFVVWYGAAILTATAVGALLGARWLKW